MLSQSVKRFFMGFGLISFCGAFTGLAGGAEWGSTGCGILAGCTLAVASAIGVAFAVN